MQLRPFEYLAPTGLHEALALLSDGSGSCLPLAGGTDLLVTMKEGKLAPPALLSLKRVPELRGISTACGTCRVGAMTTIAELGRDPLASTNPSIADAVRVMATPQIRNRATLGGNLATAAACADFPPVLLVNDAVVHLCSNNGVRDVAIGDFFTGLRQVDRRQDELLLAVSCRQRNPGSAYVKFGVRRAAVISIVGVACAVELNSDEVRELRIATTAACPMPGLIGEAQQVAQGRPATDETWRAVAAVVVRHLQPISDLRGSAKYRLHLAEVGTLRALRLAASRYGEAANA